MSQRFFGKCFFIISRIFFQGSDAHSASLETGTSLISPEVSRERSSDHKQCPPDWNCLGACRSPSTDWHPVSFACLRHITNTQTGKCAGVSSERFLGLADTSSHPGDGKGHKNAAGIISDALGQWRAQKSRWRVKNQLFWCSGQMPGFCLKSELLSSPSMWLVGGQVAASRSLRLLEDVEPLASQEDREGPLWFYFLSFVGHSFTSSPTASQVPGTQK